MNDALELRLRALGDELEFPSEPDVVSRVLERLEGRRPFAWRRTVAVAVALVALTIGTAFAVPQSRAAILRFFHLGGATVLRVETLPPAVERPKAGGLGTPVSPAEAERRVGFRLLLPPFKGDPPRHVYVLDYSVATVIVRAYPPFRPILLSEFSSFGPSSLKKVVFGETRIERVQVNGHRALWLEGGVHTLQYLDRRHGFRERPVRIHGNVLLWTRGNRTLRLEGKLTREQAIKLAQAVR